MAAADEPMLVCRRHRRGSPQIPPHRGPARSRRPRTHPLELCIDRHDRHRRVVSESRNRANRPDADRAPATRPGNRIPRHPRAAAPVRGIHGSCLRRPRRSSTHASTATGLAMSSLPTNPGRSGTTADLPRRVCLPGMFWNVLSIIALFDRYRDRAPQRMLRRSREIRLCQYKGLLHRSVLERSGKGLDLSGGRALRAQSLAPGPIDDCRHPGQPSVSHRLVRCRRTRPHRAQASTMLRKARLR